MDISTFSKASKNRDPVVFQNLFLRLRSELNQKKNIDQKALVLFPIDSTIISLTSKLLWKEGYHLLGETHAEVSSARLALQE